MEWISIKDKLPLKNEIVLVYCPEEVLKIRLCQFHDWNFSSELGMTHWQPLPEPPKP